MIARGKFAFAGLAALWMVILSWQAFEHARVRESARAELINRAKDISATAGNVMRALRRFGVVPRDRLEPALQPLIKPGDVNSIALLNETEDIVAVVGEPMPQDVRTRLANGEPYWTSRFVTVMNLVELGTNLVSSASTNGSPELNRENPVIVLNESFGRGSNNPGFGPPPGEIRSPSARPPEEGSTLEQRTAMLTNMLSAITNSLANTNPPDRRGRRGDRDGRQGFGRPPWLSEADFKSLIQKQGVHSFVIVLSIQSSVAEIARDLWLRGFIALLSAVSIVGMGLAYRNLRRSSELEVRLVRASELNTRLKEMNLAAAGLAHETKNPLNIVRGMAQLISRDENASLKVRQNSKAIVEETDRVTAQLNEFINYSRPREVRRSTVALGTLANEVARALGFDIEEKKLRVEIASDLPAIEADEQLLRQALFNLILNAVQAVEQGGVIRVTGTRLPDNELTLEICDDGPGVPAENRTNVFKPYFTTNANGTGLGLAVVQQIVLAHGWEIACDDQSPRGACFRISHIRVV
jgi:signal transduction histidine kinase